MIENGKGFNTVYAQLKSPDRRAREELQGPTASTAGSTAEVQRGLEREKQVLEVVFLGKGFLAVLGKRYEIKEREGKKMRGAGSIAGKVPVYGGRQVKTVWGGEV